MRVSPSLVKLFAPIHKCQIARLQETSLWHVATCNTTTYLSGFLFSMHVPDALIFFYPLWTTSIVHARWWPLAKNIFKLSVLWRQLYLSLRLTFLSYKSMSCSWFWESKTCLFTWKDYKRPTAEGQSFVATTKNFCRWPKTRRKLRSSSASAAIVKSF